MGVFTLWIFTKKPWKMKKAFCFDYFSMSRSESKFFHVWFEFFPSYLSKKKEISETFLGLGLRPRPQKIFPRFPFFYFGNLGKTQIRRGKILLQTWHGKKPKQNTIYEILYICVFVFHTLSGDCILYRLFIVLFGLTSFYVCVIVLSGFHVDCPIIEIQYGILVLSHKC